MALKQIAFWVKIQLGSLRDTQRDDIQIKPIIAGAFTRFCRSFGYEVTHNGIVYHFRVCTVDVTFN